MNNLQKQNKNGVESVLRMKTILPKVYANDIDLFHRPRQHPYPQYLPTCPAQPPLSGQGRVTHDLYVKVEVSREEEASHPLRPPTHPTAHTSAEESPRLVRRTATPGAEDRQSAPASAVGM